MGVFELTDFLFTIPRVLLFCTNTKRHGFDELNGGDKAEQEVGASCDTCEVVIERQTACVIKKHSRAMTV
jgi:hypothetical protein